MLILILASILLFDHVANAGTNAPDPYFRLLHTGGRIVGGDPVAEGEIPWQVSIQDLYNHHLCGGSIISPFYIITAGHCSEDLPENYIVAAGATYIYNPESTHSVVRIHTHPSYDPFTLANDISIWEIDPGFEWSPKVSPAIIPDLGTATLPDTLMTVSGWGWTGSATEPGDFPTTLQKVSVQIVNKLECRDIYADINDLNINSICAGLDGKDSCNGDSGGPLFDEGILFGIVSWGPNFGCAIPDYPGVYTEVSGYTEWVAQIVNKTTPCRIA